MTDSNRKRAIDAFHDRERKRQRKPAPAQAEPKHTDRKQIETAVFAAWEAETGKGAVA